MCAASTPKKYPRKVRYVHTMRLNQFGKIKRFGLGGTAVLVAHGLRYYAAKYALRRSHLVRRIHNYRLSIDLQDPGLSRDVAIRGSREEQLKYVIDRVVGPGDVVLDLGANIGYYTIMLAQLVGNSGKIYAMEPEPRNFERLRRNIYLNDMDGIVEAFNVGAADAPGVGRLNLSSYSNWHSFLSHDSDDSEHGLSIEVPVIDVSSFIRGKRPVDMLRMDIEGYEVEVLIGLEQAITEGSWSGKILFECHFPRYDDKTHSMRKPLSMLFRHGYRVRYMTSGDESRPLIRERGYRPIAQIQTSDTRYRGIYENVADEDVLSLICDTGGVRDVLLVKRSDDSPVVASDVTTSR